VTARILDGKQVAAQVKAEVAVRVEALRQRGVTPGLATVLVGDDPASEVYVRSKRKDAAEAGISSFHHPLPAHSTQQQVAELVAALNADPAVHGILVQLPLPAGLDSEAITESIHPGKDVDGLHPHNLGLVVLDRPGLRPCTPSGVLRILSHYGIGLAGRRAVVVGRSFLVGRPLALMLSARGVDSTVTIAGPASPT
jgi:methylenetetrahydrofolate dehydrogenase (NADP+)/methenyltetrahydrofolate cyclohydrolase